MQNIGNTIISTVVDTINRIILFIPQLISGLIILGIGLLLAYVLKYVVKRVFDLIGVDRLLARAGLEERSATGIWSEISSQVVFWFVFLAFLIPAFNAWQLSNITGLLNQVLLYIPSIFAAVIIGFVGYILGNIVYNLVKSAARGLGAANLLGSVAKYALYIFTALVALNQLGIASNLIQLLLGGLVAMAALAGGLAFGLGGQDAAREIWGRFVSPKAGRPTENQGSREPIYASQIRSGKNKKTSQKEQP